MSIPVAPVCRPGQKTIYSAGRQEAMKILCELEANPHNVTFNWKFNASATEFLDLPASQIFPEKNNAVAQYTPMTEHVSLLHFKHSNLLMQFCAFFIFIFSPNHWFRPTSLVSIQFSVLQT